MANNRDIIRRCRFTPYLKGHGPTFSLVMWDTGRTMADKSRLGYELRQHLNGHTTVLFTGEDFGASPMHAIDSNDAVASLMSFLTLRPGDTDAEYFDNYTPEQLAYCSEHAETLSAEVLARFGER